MICIKSLRQCLQRGLTMIEMILVIVVIASIVLFAVQRGNRTTTSTNIQTIDGSVKYLFDLIERYYYSQCHDLYPATSDQGPTLSETDFVDAGLITSDAYNAGVRDPFGGSASSYTINIKYKEVSQNYDPSDVNNITVWKARGYWTATVTFTMPSGMTTQAINVYVGGLKPTTVSGSTLTWTQTISTRTQRAGAPLSPQGEDLKRFSIQQFVPTSGSVGSGGNQQAYSQDYSSDYTPVSSDDAASCEAILERNIAGKEFQLRRAVQ